MGSSLSSPSSSTSSSYHSGGGGGGGIQSSSNSNPRSKMKSVSMISPLETTDEDDMEVDLEDDFVNQKRIIVIESDNGTGNKIDYISELPDECIAYIFQSLGSGDRKNIEGQSRHRLSLDAKSDLLAVIPSLFSRFDSVTKLALKCVGKTTSIGDDALILISFRCRNLTRLKLRACRELTDTGMIGFAKNCLNLKKLSCGSCTFGAKGMNAVLNHCGAGRVIGEAAPGITDGAAAEPIGPGLAAGSLKTICLKELYNGQCFGPLIVGSKKLKTLKLFRSERVSGLVEVHLERLQVSDRGLASISNSPNLEILHLVKTPESSWKLHIDGWRTNRIGDEGLIAIAKSCSNLQELVLISLGSNCLNLERLALCGSESIGDAEISCIAAKFVALRKLCIKACPVSDSGMEALAGGCPKLVKVKIKKCKGVTCDGADWLRASRQTDGGAQETAAEFTPLFSQNAAAGGADVASSSNGRSALPKARLALFAGRNFVACTFGRWANSNNGSHSS
ncbi:hypothetical protein MKW92_026308 [Papaver armeniacum]|nr:hypothetical protein MKW92_026308 [Papaver armeniacum]